MARRARPVELEPSYNDRQIAKLMHRAAGEVREPGRFGDRKVFIAPLWDRMRALDTEGLTEGFTIDDFKGWLLRSFQLTEDDGHPLFRMARADFVAAMDPEIVAASEITQGRGGGRITYHFVIDPAVGRAAGRADGYEPNPAWATEAIAEAWETIGDQIPNRWFPKMRHVRGAGPHAIVASIKEYGCGTYGCAFPTSDPKTVMKLTTDTTEAEFAANFANDLVRPICVRYYTVIRLAATHKDRPIFLLWRESAEHVGAIGTVVGARAAEDIDLQHHAAQIAFSTLQKMPGTQESAEAIDDWIAMCHFMASTPELKDIATGMVEIWEKQHIVFGDVHSGNVGLVAREDGGHWVITDPGNIAVVAP